jgi:hypothetical protein
VKSRMRTPSNALPITFPYANALQNRANGPRASVAK